MPFTGLAPVGFGGEALLVMVDARRLVSGCTNEVGTPVLCKGAPSTIPSLDPLALLSSSAIAIAFAFAAYPTASSPAAGSSERMLLST